ncbi:hypothetical protein SM2011_c07130 [Sinorhizobium meliloti 2011]|nr:hypothetical protein SM2011_c07130 [Sinorhizobium meliloti 2011]
MTRRTFFCVDAHTCGNSIRVVAGSAPLLPKVWTPRSVEVNLSISASQG